MVEPDLAAIAWPRACLIVAARFPEVPLWEGIPPEFWDRLDHLEALTNPRLRTRQARSSYVQWPFRNPRPGRFSTDTLGAFYAAREQAAAIAETVHYQAIRCREDRLEPHEFDMRVLGAKIQVNFHDVRAERAAPFPGILDPASHGASRVLATALAERGSAGLVFNSVRDPAHGACVAAFRPEVVLACSHLKFLAYRWTGEQVLVLYEKRPI